MSMKFWILATLAIVFVMAIMTSGIKAQDNSLDSSLPTEDETLMDYSMLESEVNNEILNKNNNQNKNHIENENSMEIEDQMEAELNGEQEGENEHENEQEGENENENEQESEQEGEQEQEQEQEQEHEQPSLLEVHNEENSNAIREALEKVEDADELVALVEEQSKSTDASLAAMEAEAHLNHLRVSHSVQVEQHNALLEEHKKLLQQHEKEHENLLKQQETALIEEANKLHLNSPDILLDPLLKIKREDEHIEQKSVLAAVGLEEKPQIEKEIDQHIALLEEKTKAKAQQTDEIILNKPNQQQKKQTMEEREKARQIREEQYRNRAYIPADQRAEHDAAFADEDEQNYLKSRVHQ